MNYTYFATDEKICNALPLYILSYSGNYSQVKTTYSEGAICNHIIYTLSGTGHFEMKGKRYEITQGDILFFKSYIPCFYESTDNWKNCFVTFCGYGTEKIFDYYDFPDCFVLKNEEIAQKIKELCICADKQVSQEKLSAMLYPLVNDIGQIINASAIPAEYEKAVAFIRHNFSQDITLNDILAAAGTSHSTLYRQFYEQAQTTPIKYLNKLRIDISKMHLKADDRNISAIAQIVGFSSTNYFIETFKKLEKTTPLQYRKKKQ